MNIQGIHKLASTGLRGRRATGHRDGIQSARGWFLGLVLLLAACGSPHPVADDPHVDLMIGASSPDGGALVVDYDFDQVFEVFENTVVGGFVLWSGSDPGFGLVEFDEPEEGVYPLESGVEVTLVITALDPGVQFQFGAVTLDKVGDSVVLGSSPGLHGHGEWQVILPEGTESGEYRLSFRLLADRIYDPSESVEARLVPMEGDDHDDHGDHDGDHGDHDGDHDDHDGDHDDHDGDHEDHDGDHEDHDGDHEDHDGDHEDHDGDHEDHDGDHEDHDGDHEDHDGDHEDHDGDHEDHDEDHEGH